MSGIEIALRDQLIEMDEDELRARMRNIRRAIRRCLNRDKRMQLEVECCYFYREIEIRAQRRSAHAKYLASKNRNRRENRGVV